MRFYFDVNIERYVKLCLHRLLDKTSMDLIQLYTYIEQFSYPNGRDEVMPVFKETILKLINEDSIEIFEYDFKEHQESKINFSNELQKFQEIFSNTKKWNMYSIFPSSKTKDREFEITEGKKSVHVVEFMLAVERRIKGEKEKTSAFP